MKIVRKLSGSIEHRDRVEADRPNEPVARHGLNGEADRRRRVFRVVPLDQWAKLLRRRKGPARVLDDMRHGQVFVPGIDVGKFDRPEAELRGFRERGRFRSHAEGPGVYRSRSASLLDKRFELVDEQLGVAPRLP